ncbi:hypothetical protein KSP40_PGU019912 [Platanthera guangdongensis]|uniref:Uncharacterized protein n=1 Tax=Platanthera guangdongensis TaxID=2320717 RepID=A0ABR2MBP2_9ASPA
MNFNCLLCERGGGSPDIDGELRQPHRTCYCCGVDRSLSGKLSPPPYANLRRTSSVESCRRNGHGNAAASSLPNKFVKQPLSSAAAVASGEPRLVRSGGMRRDWSFEDLGNLRNARKR